MASFRRFEDIECWQLARKLDNELYPFTKTNGFERDFNLKDQILKSSGSIMDNICEGFSRRGNKEFVRFLSYSHGSAGEIQSQLCRAMDRGYISNQQFQSLYTQAKTVERKLGSLMGYLDSSDYKPNYQRKNNEIRDVNTEPGT
jgi:four helix bundle protein